MSMICNLRRVSREEINLLLEAPERVTAFLYGDEAAQMDAPRGLFARLFGRPKPPPTARVQWAPRRDGDEMDLDKFWHALHFLFTGTQSEGTEPANYLLTGGEPIGDVDVGYGPARALLAEHVQQFAAYLDSLTSEELERRYDPKRLTKLTIYPEIWDEMAGSDENPFDYVRENFETLRDFVRKARAADEGIVIYIN